MNLEELKNKFNQLYYSKKKVIAVIKNPTQYLTNGTPFLVGGKLILVKKGNEYRLKMVYKDLSIRLPEEDLIMSYSEKDNLIRKEVAHIIATYASKYHRCKYNSVIWALMEKEENVPPGWECPTE